MLTTLAIQSVISSFSCYEAQISSTFSAFYYDQSNKEFLAEASAGSDNDLDDGVGTMIKPMCSHFFLGLYYFLVWSLFIAIHAVTGK
jgi:hypothetical protein